MPGRPSTDIHQNKDGSITIQYKPTEKGLHELNLSCNEQPVDGTPFRCHVDAVGSGFVTAYGMGLSQGASGQESHFTVVGGDPTVTIDGPAKADITKNETKNGLTNVTYLPMSPGEYEVSIKCKGKHIHGSPFSAKVSGEGRKRSQMSLIGTSEISLATRVTDLAGLVGSMKTPAGKEELCLLKKMSDGQLGVASFTPKSKGVYAVDVKKNGSPIAGSPFKINVGDSQVASPAKVKVTGDGASKALANVWNKCVIDISNAGHGALAISIEGGHRSDIQTEETDPKKYQLSYKPHEPGIYLLNIRFADDHIAGSPFMINVGGEPSGRVRVTKSVNVPAAPPTGAGSKCEVQLKIPGCDPLDMEATLTAPSGKSELCEIADLPDNLYDIKFEPAEEGVHTVSLKHKGLHISGSPFQYTVGPSPSGGTHKVEIGGPGLERGEVGEKNEFNIYTREAGAGKLLVAIEGPSEANINIKEGQSGYTIVSYTVSKPGEYGIHVKFGHDGKEEDHVPDSPSMVNIIPESKDAKKVTVTGLRDRGLAIDKPATFNVNLGGAQGELKSHVDTPSGTEEDVFIQEIDREVHALRFIPKENGIYYVHVKLNEAHIPGSPFPMLVGKLGADPALVLAKGDGLEKGVSGSAAKFLVTTVNSGAGTLNVNIEGPSKVAIMCTEVDEGYEFSYTPMAPGDYLINIKYCNITIAGCPCKATVTGKGRASEMKETSSLVVETVEKKEGQSSKKRFSGDASKVTVKGNGVKKSFANRPANFTIDVSKAGQGMLMLGIVSGTGNPVGEMSYKKTSKTVYTVTYRPVEKGEHQMTIRWGPDDVPGSPFALQVV